MTAPGNPFDHFGASLSCPRCGNDQIRIRDVYVAGFHDDHTPVTHIHVLAYGEVRTRSTYMDECPLAAVPGDRDIITLVGSCTECPDEFTFTFRERLGKTVVNGEYMPLGGPR